MLSLKMKNKVKNDCRLFPGGVPRGIRMSDNLAHGCLSAVWSELLYQCPVILEMRASVLQIRVIDQIRRMSMPKEDD
jgi:hypothetical protein